MDWPESFYELRRGDGCPMCEQGRPEETPYGARIFAGEVSDAYLQHATRPRITRKEAARYWLEVLEVGRRLERHLGPVKMNYDVLGNSLPHLHTHVIPRYADDPKPGWPFPFPEGEPGQLDADEFRRDVEALRQ